MALGTPEGYVIRKKGRVWILVREDLARSLDEIGVYGSCRPERWMGADGSVSGGRTGMTRIRLRHGPCMLVKALVRGGVLNRFNCNIHLSARRLMHEAELSSHLHRKGVPAVCMLLGRAERCSIFFRKLHLGFEEAAGSVNLLDLLMRENRKDKDVRETMRSAGVSVLAMHNAGVYHNDLNLGNLLSVSEGFEHGDVRPVRVKIIDLGGSYIRDRLSAKARVSNLARLYRHAKKNSLHDKMDLRSAWLEFLEGYCGGKHGVRSLEADVERAFRRSFVFHRISWFLQGG